MKDLLTTIKIAKTACPELRVGQLLINALSYTDRKDLFFISDEELTKALQDYSVSVKLSHFSAEI